MTHHAPRQSVPAESRIACRDLRLWHGSTAPFQHWKKGNQSAQGCWQALAVAAALIITVITQSQRPFHAAPSRSLAPCRKSTSQFRRCPLPDPIDDTVDVELSSCSSCQTAWTRCMNVDAHRLRRSCISSLLSLMRTWTWIDSLTSRLRAGLV